jgi:oxygen-independent coproporphyrinogen III oxidase
MKPIQKNIPQFALPQPQEKLEIWRMAIDELTNSGYQFIGMDHFAKPHDELAISQQHHSLKRNFQGYTTKPEAELFGFGATSISMLHDAYGQNHKRLKDYYQAIDARILPISKGIKLNHDDILRRDVIMNLMSNFLLDKVEIDNKYHIDFDDYFWSEIEGMKHLEEDGLLKLYPDRIEVTEIGRLLVRNIAVLFDNRTQMLAENKHSKAI